jgi:hypothetical protein
MTKGHAKITRRNAWAMSIRQSFPKSMDVLEFDAVLRDPVKLAEFLESTLGSYILLYDQTLTGITFDNMAIVLAKASTMGYRVVSITTASYGSSLYMYALIEKTK